jgi:hypothetical protein
LQRSRKCGAKRRPAEQRRLGDELLARGDGASLGSQAKYCDAGQFQSPIMPQRTMYTHSVRTMPRIVTHRYDPKTCACPNLCCLPQSVAGAILDKLRRESRPTLKANYLNRRHVTEEWLRRAATETLRRELRNRPAYFFLGDFSHGNDVSRSANLILPISILPIASITFTLGDSMTVVEHPNRSVYVKIWLRCSQPMP